MQWLTCGTVFALFSIGYSDYPCVCNNNAETPVLSKPSSQSNVLGNMYEYDCKPQAGQSGNDQWIAIAFEHKLGYVEKDPKLQIHKCAGAPLDEDKLVTASQRFSSITITQKSTTLPITSPSTTLPTTITTQSTTLPTTITTQSTTLPTTITTQSTTLPTTVTKQSTTLPTTVTSQSTTLPTTVTTQSTTTKRIATLQGHLELCPNIIQHLAKQPGELIAQFSQKCYEVVQASVSWSHAESNCKHNGGHLVEIASQQEQDFIYSFLQKHNSHSVWLGLHDRSQEKNFEWTSGDPVTYTNWKAGRKDYRYHNSEDCVYMTPTNGTWDDIQCGGDNALSELLQGHRHAYICQYATMHPSQSDGNINMCPYSLHQQAERDKGVLGQYGHSCYELIQNARVDWQRAESVCHSRHGHLAEISNAQEQNFLLGFLNRYSKDHAVWIGLTDLNSEGHFHWSSGSPVQFTNWVPDHISNFVNHTLEDCTVFIPYKKRTVGRFTVRTYHSLPVWRNILIG